MAAAVDERSWRKTDVVTTGFGSVEGFPSSRSRGIARKSRRETTSRRFFEDFEERKKKNLQRDWREQYAGSKIAVRKNPVLKLTKIRNIVGKVGDRRVQV